MRTILTLAAAMCALGTFAQQASVSGPDKRLTLNFELQGGRPTYSVTYDGRQMLEQSPLGFTANTGNYATSMSYAGSSVRQIDERYTLNRSKVSDVHYVASELKVDLTNGDDMPVSIVFRVSDNSVAFRYEIPKKGDTGSVRIMNEMTGFDFPSKTTTFICPQSDPMIGWKRTKPSYEEEYKYDAPLMDKSSYGHGYTFPCLFHVGEDGWVLVSETGVDSRYCGSRLSDVKEGGLYTVEFPMPEENNGNGTVEPAFALPGATPWRTLTVGSSLKPIVETTAPWDNVEPRFETKHDYKFGKGTWSWIVWQDASINYEDQAKFVDLAHDMGYSYVLIDCGWDINIGKERMEELVKYARSKGVDIFLWYSSSGYWNDITQSPINLMDNPIPRKQYMRWMQSIGVKGIKVDFFGGDKQETMRLYEAILSDADDFGLMVIFHGCTLPRGWERMYPNYVGSEAVLASENLIFNQHFCDEEAHVTALHPFCRNAVGCMEFGGSFLNRRMARDNKGGKIRMTTDAHELAQAVLFQNPVQNFAVTPENLKPESEGGAPAVSVNFMKEVPTTWDETVFLDGYPGKYVVIARRHGDKWYIAGTNAEAAAKTVTLSLPMASKGDKLELITDNAKTREPEKSVLKVGNPAKVKLTIQPSGGFVLVK